MSRKREQRKREQLRRLKARQRQTEKPNRSTSRKLLESATATATRTASQYLRRDNLAGNVVELADAMRELALRVMRQSPLNGKHECKPGCDFCCYTAVTVAPPEAFAVAGYLAYHHSPQELSAVRRHMGENAALASSMSREKYIARLVPCALRSQDGNCRAHPVRPIACAGFLSTSRARCEDEFNRVPDREPVPTDRYAMLAGLSVSNGLTDTCRDAGLDGNFYELHHALCRVMDTPDAADRWARGENVFDGCLR